MAKTERVRTSGGALFQGADYLLGFALLAGVWKLSAFGIGKDIILPTPDKVFVTFAKLCLSPRFQSALAATALRGLAAFAVSMIVGSALGFFTAMSPRFARLISPLMAIIRATPVLAIILIALIWFPSGIVPIFSAVLMAFPVVLADVAAGVRSVDGHLVSMAVAFRVSPADILWKVRFPSALPHIVAAARNSLGLAWKVVVAGEVLSQPPSAIGTGMQTARVMLETTEVFAWAAAGILLCAVSDALFALAARKFKWTTA